jgi:hypothetical protein
MDIQLTSKARVLPGQTESYMAFRTAIPKPSSEEAHLRHILRFYIARALQKRAEQDIHILPAVTVGDKTFTVDVAAGAPGRHILAICEPASVTPATEEILDALKDVDGVEVIVVHSQYAKPGSVQEKFSRQIESKKFSILAVVPPPFDDVYEYDIWMFETTFRNIFQGS